MADNKKERALQVYNTLCSAIEGRDWKYDKIEEDLVVHFSVSGDDLPMVFIMRVDEERELISLHSHLGFDFPEDKRVEGAVATCAVTYKLADGCFDYDISDGAVMFRLVACYRGSEVGEMLFQYMISCACTTVDKYNDKFFALSKGMIDLSAFLE